jgi:hypothetical protein
VKERTSGPEFLRRTAVSALVSGIVLGLALAVRFGWLAGAGFVAAMFWGLANFAVLAAILRNATDPAGVRKRRLLGWVVLKALGLYGLGIWVLIQGWFPIAALASGFGWPLVVGLLRVLGALWSSRGDATQAGGSPAPRP